MTSAATAGVLERRQPDVPLDPIEPWILLPSQTIGGSAASTSGEKRLLAAVLADAIQLYVKHGRGRNVASGILFREAERWFASDDRSWLLSFQNVCDVLQLDAARIRGALRTHLASGAVRAISFDAGRLRVARGRKIRI